MSEKDKQTATSIASALEDLPSETREYIRGVAEGMAMAKAKEAKREE